MDPQKKHSFRRGRRRKRPAIARDSLRWAITIVAWTFIISIGLSYSSGAALETVGYLPASLMLIFFILLGILFDIIGLAVATASEKPFHSMSSRRVPGALQALWLLRRADKVTSICNDMVGDIAGIITGVTSVLLASRFASDLSVPFVATQLIAASLASALTVGGKALGKGMALHHNIQIVHGLGRLMFTVSKMWRRKVKK